MARCSHCHSFILAGGIREAEKRFCSADCRDSALIKSAAGQVAPESVDRLADETFNGPCPICGKSGFGVDVHTARWNYSAIIVSVHQSRSYTCCQKCAAKRQLLASGASLLLGWWSIWGLVLTPLHVGANIRDIFVARRRKEPSAALRRRVHLDFASKVPAATCRKCGYDIRTQREMNLPRCPECGSEIVSPSTAVPTT